MNYLKTLKFLKRQPFRIPFAFWSTSLNTRITFSGIVLPRKRCTISSLVLSNRSSWCRCPWEVPTHQAKVTTWHRVETSESSSSHWIFSTIIKTQNKYTRTYSYKYLLCKLYLLLILFFGKIFMYGSSVVQVFLHPSNRNSTFDEYFVNISNITGRTMVRP